MHLLSSRSSNLKCGHKFFLNRVMYSVFINRVEMANILGEMCSPKYAYRS